MGERNTSTGTIVPLRARLTLLISLAVLIFGIANLVTVGWSSYKALTREQDRRLRFVAALLSQRLHEPLLFDDRVGLDKLVQQSKEIDPDIAYVLVLDPSGRIIVDTFDGRIPPWVIEHDYGSHWPRIAAFRGEDGRDYRDVAADILSGRLGVVRVGMVETRVRGEVASLLSILAAMVSGFLLLGLMAAFLIARRVTRPLDQIVGALEEFRLDGGPLKLEVNTKDELSIVAEKVRSMASRLQGLYRQEREHERELMRVERLAALGVLSAGIAHEVNNPLAGIKNAAQRLDRFADQPDRVRRYAAVIEDSANRVARIVRRILAFSRPGTPSIEVVELMPTVRRAIEVARPRLSSAGAELTVENVAGDPAAAVDRDLLEQILVNLLLNAADATAGRPERKIRLSVAPAGGERISIRVIDSGSGVSQEISEQIFDPFFTTKNPGSGTGLGLAVSWKAAKEMGGDLVLERSNGSGAAFRLDLRTAEEQR